MLRRILFLVCVALVVSLSSTSKAQAYYSYHASYHSGGAYGGCHYGSYHGCSGGCYRRW
jgi:hypothetical protein